MIQKAGRILARSTTVALILDTEALDASIMSNGERIGVDSISRRFSSFGAQPRGQQAGALPLSFRVLRALDLVAQRAEFGSVWAQLDRTSDGDAGITVVLPCFARVERPDPTRAKHGRTTVMRR